MGSSIFLVVVSFLVAVSRVEPALKRSELGLEIQKFVEALRPVCILRSGTDDESINKVINGVFTEEPKIKAYMKCLFDESGLVDENGDLLMDLMVQAIPSEIADEVLKNTKICDAKRKEIKDQFDKAFIFFKCIYNQNPNTFIFF